MTKERFVVRGLSGERRLSGTLSVFGAKNAALQAFAFSLLFEDCLRLERVPEIEDTRTMAGLLVALGVGVEALGGRNYLLTPGPLLDSALSPALSRRLRASVVLTGPLLARTGKVVFPHPGGCVIGKRPIDIFLDGFQRMGATVTEGAESNTIVVPSGKLSGADIFLRLPSVTATQTFMMAAVLAHGTTVIRNAAMEPETATFADYLNACGADIAGAGTSEIIIRGTEGKPLRAGGRAYRIPPDRIEAGSFLILAALAGKEMTIADCEPCHLDALTSVLRECGVPMEIGRNSIRVSAGAEPYRSVDIKTHEYPGFPTDLQAPMTVFLTQTTGEGVVFETIFEGRLNYTESLVRMGAEIKLWDAHRAMVKGPTPLHAKELESPDIRAGLAFLIAAIIAKGESVIHNAYYIDRGYEAIEKRLQAVGVNINRVVE